MALVFGAASEKHLTGVTPVLVRVCRRALELGEKVGCDFNVVDGLRSPQEATANSAKGTSQTNHSKHLAGPDGLSRAVDICPYPKMLNGTVVDSNGWAKAPGALSRWWTLRTLMFLAAAEEGVKLRWGGDWDGDLDMSDHSFLDAYHFELV